MAEHEEARPTTGEGALAPMTAPKTALDKVVTAIPFRGHFARHAVALPVLVAAFALAAAFARGLARTALFMAIASVSMPYFLRLPYAKAFLRHVLRNQPYRSYFFRMVWRPHLDAVRLFSLPILHLRGRSLPCTRVCLDNKAGVREFAPPPRTPHCLRFVAISDTHTRHADIFLPQGDVLIHCGDFDMPESRPQAPKQTLKELCGFFACAVQKGGFRTVLFVPGNHERFVLDLGVDTVQKELDTSVPCDARLLVDAGVFLRANEIGSVGVAVYGTPHSVANSAVSPNCAFQAPFGSTDKPAAITMLPRSGSLDVLITHGPPASVDPRGCAHLDAVLDSGEVPHPHVHVFGHTHEGAGQVTPRPPPAVGTHRCVSVNACSIDMSFCASQPPVVFDIPIRGRADAPEGLEVVGGGAFDS